MTEPMQNFSDLLKTLTKAEALAAPIVHGQTDRQYALIPDGYKLQEITDPDRLAARPKAKVKVDDRAGLVTYTNLHQTKQSMIFGDYDAGTITTVIDWHPHNQDTDQRGQSGAQQHAVTLTLLPSEEFSRWHNMQNKMHKQADFALFLEENASDIHFPEPGIMLELARDLEGVTGQTFKARTRLTDGSHAFAFETENKITSRVTAPEEFHLMIPLYNGEDPELLTAKFRWRPTSEGLLLGFVWHRVEYMRRARFTQIVAAASEATNLPWIAGRF